MAAVLILTIAVVFSQVLEKPQNVVPLYLVPAFLYAGYASVEGGFKAWLAVTLAITVALCILYALP